MYGDGNKGDSSFTGAIVSCLKCRMEDADAVIVDTLVPKASTYRIP